MDGKEALTRQLGGAHPPEGIVTGLATDDLEHLAGVLRDARRRQAEALAASADGALRVIPGVLRRPVKKVLGL